MRKLLNNNACPFYRGNIMAAADVEKGNGGLLACPVFKLLLYGAQGGIETPLLWPTGTGLLLHGGELKEETTTVLDAAAMLIDHEGKTTVVPVHLGLETPGRLAGAGIGGYGPETCYSRALMLAVPNDASYYSRCSSL